MENQPQLSGKAISWLLSALLLLVAGQFTFSWQMSKDMAVLKDHDDMRTVEMQKIQENLNGVNGRIESIITQQAIQGEQFVELQKQLNQLENARK